MAQACRLELVVALPVYREQVLAAAPAIARLAPAGHQGLLWLRLSESQGRPLRSRSYQRRRAMPMQVMRAQRACCTAVDGAQHTGNRILRTHVDMFNEWQLAGSRWWYAKALASVAINSMAPGGSIPLPRVPCCSSNCSRAARPARSSPIRLRFEWRDGVQHGGDLRIDLVYNRLTDYLEQLVQAPAARSVSGSSGRAGDRSRPTRRTAT
jgi:hypothetical protein